MKRNWLDSLRFSGAGLFFAGAVLLALLAGLSVFSVLAAQAPTEAVWALVRDVTPGEVLQPGDLQAKSVPAGAAPPGAVRSREEVAGKRLRYGLAAGDLLRKTHLIEAKSDVAQLLAEMGPSYRLVAIPVANVPAAHRVVPGDRLELTAVLPLQEKGVSTTVAVSLGEAVVIDATSAKDADKGAVLVAIATEQVQRLAVSQRAGTVMYTLLGSSAQAPTNQRLRLDPDLVGSPPPAGARAGG
jgi:Flp pilus assembly protein CpaB